MSPATFAGRLNSGVSLQVMDPRNLHIQFEHSVRAVQWDSPGGNEYFLIGDGAQFYFERMQAALDKHFPSAVILASPSRHEAVLFERASAAETIARHISRTGSLTVFDEQMTTFMQFTKTGVARQGVLQANNSFKPTPLRG